MSQDPDPHYHSRRDAETLGMLGTFISILSVAVLIGTFYAERQHAMVVNVIAGLVLLSIGAGFIARAIWISRRIR